ncbi:unnamed protein product, partial [Amoebophrya sp. A120]
DYLLSNDGTDAFAPGARASAKNIQNPTVPPFTAAQERAILANRYGIASEELLDLRNYRRAPFKQRKTSFDARASTSGVKTRAASAAGIVTGTTSSSSSRSFFLDPQHFATDPNQSVTRPQYDSP